MKRFLYQLIPLLALSWIRGLFGLWPFHPLFGLVILFPISSKSRLLKKRFLTFALLIGVIYEFIDPIQPVGIQVIASMGAFLAVREATLKIDPPKNLTLPLYTTLYSFVFELTIVLICLHYIPSGLVLFKRLVLLPFIDGAISFLWFILPKYVITYVNKREKTQATDA